MRYFITGATGFIGGAIVRRLVEDGEEVIALVRTPSKAKELADLGITLHHGDITDWESMREAMAGVNGVFHVAAWYKIGARDTSMAHRINVEGTRNVLELMRELAIPKGVYTSTLAIFSDTHGKLVDEGYRYDGPHLSIYDETKWRAHYEVALPMMERGLPLVIVMPGLVYGPGDTSSMHETFITYLKGKLPILPRETALCWAHVDDIAQAHITAMKLGKPGESYIIAGPPYTFVEAFELAERITGVKAPRIRVSPGAMKVMAAFMKGIGKILPLPSIYSGEALRVTAGVTYIGSNAKARRELGYEPRSLEEGLRQTLTYEMKRLGIRSKD